jgi:septal ring factor EnvC (AmiA/AmiB activator)
MKTPNLISDSSVYIFYLISFVYLLSFFKVEEALLAQKKMELESSNTSAQTLHNELNMAHKQMTVLEQQVANLQEETKCFSETINHLREDKAKLEAELEDQKRRNSSLEVASDSFFSFSVYLM